MNDAIEPDQAVWEAICDLHEVLHARDWCANCGLIANPKEFQRAWSALKDALSKCREVIQDPRPGQGLISIWLRSIHERAAKADPKVTRWPMGWQEFVRYDEDVLLRLVTNDRERGYAVAKHLNAGRTDFPELFAPQLSVLELLRDLAHQWAIKWHQIEEAARARGGQPHLSEYNNAPEIKRAGQLLLDAVNSCELPPGRMDGETRERILRCVDTPSSLVWGNMTGAGEEDLIELIKRLLPPAAPPDIEPDGPLSPYPTPATYERDKWIYDNIEHYTCRTLSVEMERLARTRGWEPLVSRSQIKESADKYSSFHRLPQRRFRGG